MTDRFRKKPVEIEAMQFYGDLESARAILEWAHRGGDPMMNAVIRFASEPLHLIVRTLEGELRAAPGDWIIRGVKGEFYPCKPDIFEATYEPASVAAVGEPMNLRMFVADGVWFIRGLGASGSGETPEAAMRDLVRHRNPNGDRVFLRRRNR